MNTIIAYYRGIPITRTMCFKGFMVNGRPCQMNPTGPLLNPELSRIIKSLPASSIRELPARFHCAAYAIGGTIYDRKFADETFFILMDLIIKKSYPKWWQFLTRWKFQLQLNENFNFIRNYGLKNFFSHVIPNNKIHIHII